MQALAQLMRAEPTLKLSIEGHTDHIGSAADNRKLSLQRAEAVQRAVCALGIAPARLSALGHGADLPVADRRSEEGRAKNRRVELIKRL
ncbi:MAG: OmpA family protein [Paucibacter sp.]|nr:OmpA family protein [Roseateles sp.]